ncbi:MAG: ABC transporter substrate-binding protein [Acholeplasmataceae bacterium]|jgi:peptide/nickel transport system substrate-binding protein
MIKKILCTFFVFISILFVVSCNNNSVSGFNGNYDEALGLNPEKTLRTIGTWTKTGIVNHWHSGTDAGPMIMYGIEGLVQYVRTTDTYYYLLAESIVNNDNGTTTINLRENAKWHDGTSFVADDVLAFYAIDYQNDICKYWSKLEKVDDKTLLITWKTYREPSDEAKIMLLAVDTKLGSVQYKEFKDYADRALNVINSLEDISPEDLKQDYTSNIVQPYGKKWNSSASAQMGAILNEMRAYEPSWYIATGPYKLQRYTETEMILEKNENYYLDNSKSFDKIYVYQTPNNVNQIYSMLANGTIDYFDGCPLAETIDDILVKNPSMVHYKMIDQNSCGLYFNLEKDIWENIKVREAFQYIFDREQITKFSQPYATVSWYPMLTMTQSQAEKCMSPDAFNKLPKYSNNLDTAKKLLEEAGWRKTDNIWYDENGKKVDLTLGVENITLFVNMAQVVQNQLNMFGITTTIKLGENWGTWFATGRQDDSIYDFVVGVTDANSYTTHPYGFMRHFFDVLNAHMLHLPTSKVTSRWDVTLERADGMGTVELIDEIDKLYLIEGEELMKTTDNIVYGFAKHLFGVQFFENVTGSFFNTDTVWGLPGLEELAKDSRNIEYIPQPKDRYFNEIADLNAYYTQGSVYGLGIIYPRD